MSWIKNVSEREAEVMVALDGTVCISITEPERPEGSLPPLHFPHVLRLKFSDFDPATLKWQLMDDKLKDTYLLAIFGFEEANAIRDFALAHRGDNFLVHCAAGVSRSAAVAEVLLEAFPEYTDAGGIRYPNPHVKALLKRVFGLVPLGAEEEEK